jgi:alanyl-tRNA synthetase
MLGDDICHLCKLVKGDLIKNINNIFQLEIDVNRRKKIKSNHTATHLLHKALKIVLGSHVQQAGSLVSDNKLRFDLTHYEKLSLSELSKIEKIINDNVLENSKLEVKNEKYKDAKKQGAEALFGEKYGDVVRVIKISDFSVELCGGTHVSRTGDIGLMKIISESSLASGIRRIEAVTGMEALKYINGKINIVNNMKQMLHCNSEDIFNKLDELTQHAKENLKLKNDLQSIQIDDIFNQKENPMKTINDIHLYQEEIKFSIDVKCFVDKFSNRYKKNSIFLLGIKIDKPMIVLSLTKDLIKNNNAGLIVKKVADEVGSGGGGPSHFGTAGFTNQNMYNKAFKLLLKNLNKI